MAPSTPAFSPDCRGTALHFGVNRSAAAVGHDQTIEAEHHAGAVLNLARNIHFGGVSALAAES